MTSSQPVRSGVRLQFQFHTSIRYSGTTVETSPSSSVTRRMRVTWFSSAILASVSAMWKTTPSSCMAQSFRPRSVSPRRLPAIEAMPLSLSSAFIIVEHSG